MPGLDRFNKEFFYNFFVSFERVVTVVLSLIISLIIIISMVRVLSDLFNLFVLDFGSPQNIEFSDYQLLFGKIMTLLIGLEFLNSIIKVIRSHQVRNLVMDVVLICALAVTRKLIIYDYDHHEPTQTLALSMVLVSLGVFYFLVNHNRSKIE